MLTTPLDGDAQPSWSTMRAAVRDRLGDADTATMRDLEVMATLCPDVVVLVSIHKSAPDLAHPLPTSSVDFPCSLSTVYRPHTATASRA